MEQPYVIEPQVHYDDRGYFMETWRRFSKEFPNISWLQENESCSKKGVMRGYHWQLYPFAQAKLVRVVKGKVIDYAVDIRKDSPTFGNRWEVELTGDNKKQFYIPVGFAHGFLCLEDDTIFQYKCSNVYSKEHEMSFNVNDFDIPFIETNIILSDKDKNAKHLNEISEKYLL